MIEYLKRPDCKQEFVSQWQRQYNELSLEMRQQDFMKSELHHRVDVRERERGGEREGEGEGGRREGGREGDGARSKGNVYMCTYECTCLSSLLGFM